MTTEGSIAGVIEHTLLRPESTAADIRKLCCEARDHGFLGVCVNSSWVGLAASLLDGTEILPVAVVGFPLGACLSETKALEARLAVRAGAREIDMVIDLGAVKGRDHARALQDVRAVVVAAGTVPVKVIIETAKLCRDEMVMACTLANASGAAFVKTSTGFGGGGARPEDIALMRSVVGKNMRIKASGGIGSLSEARTMIDAGADRIGASRSVAILMEEGSASSA